MNEVITLLSEVTATGKGALKALPNIKGPYTVHVVFTNQGGSVTALEVHLEGSLNNVDSHSLHDNEAPYVFSAADLAAKSAMFHVANRNVMYANGNLTVLTSTGTTKVTMYLLGI